MSISRRSFLTNAALGGVALSSAAALGQTVPDIVGFDNVHTDIDPDLPWEPVCDRKVKMGLVGFGLCQFSVQFGLQNHPNVEVVAVSDLVPERAAALSVAARCEKIYPSLEEMVKDREIEAIFLGTDAPSHAQQCLLVLRHGKHVATACPAVFGLHEIETAEELLETVKSTGLVYSMFETSAYHDNTHAMRIIYRAGGFGKMVYSEGEYFHYFPTPYPSWKDWRVGLPPMFYPTHSTAFYNHVTGGSFTEVSCLGRKTSIIPQFQKENNVYGNEFSSEIALLRTSEGGSARMSVVWDVQGYSVETGRNFGETGSFVTQFQGSAAARELVSNLKLRKRQLPPGVDPGGHGGSHGYLGNDFVEAILLNRRPPVDIIAALNMSVPGLIAYQSSLKDGELLKIPQYSWQT